jgi:hypothetical protein
MPNSKRGGRVQVTLLWGPYTFRRHGRVCCVHLQKRVVEAMYLPRVPCHEFTRVVAEGLSESEVE